MNCQQLFCYCKWAKRFLSSTLYICKVSSGCAMLPKKWQCSLWSKWRRKVRRGKERKKLEQLRQLQNTANRKLMVNHRIDVDNDLSDFIKIRVVIKWDSHEEKKWHGQKWLFYNRTVKETIHNICTLQSLNSWCLYKKSSKILLYYVFHVTSFHIYLTFSKSQLKHNSSRDFEIHFRNN